MPADAPFAEQPSAGFNYDYWFVCTECSTRIRIGAEDYELQTTGQAGFQRCRCGIEIDIGRVSPTLRNPEDVALNDDSVEFLYWYTSSRYQNWPDSRAYAADITTAMAFMAEMGRDPDRIVKRKLALALHVGTYEAAIENMFRRLRDQDGGDRTDIQYWLHRVQLQLAPGDLDPIVGEEFPTMFGDVELSTIHARGARACRYVNTHEAIGSISMAIDPAVVDVVSTIALPAATAAPQPTQAATDATAKAIAALTAIAPLKPDIAGIDTVTLNGAQLRSEPKDPSDPESVRIFTAARQLDDYHHRSRKIWSTLRATLVAEYLPDVNPQVRRRFLDALPSSGDPAAYHHRFRANSGLLTRSADVIMQFDSAPSRHVGRTELS